MSYLTSCPNGHEYVAADVYKNWPDDMPKCPQCRAGVPAVHKTNPLDAPMLCPGCGQKHHAILLAPDNRVLRLTFPCGAEWTREADGVRAYWPGVCNQAMSTLVELRRQLALERDNGH